MIFDMIHKVCRWTVVAAMLLIGQSCGGTSVNRRGPTLRQEAQLERWLTCIECSDGERDSLLASAEFSPDVVERLVTTLIGPPDSVAMSNIEQNLAASWALLGDTAVHAADFADYYRANYVALRRKRAAILLGDLGDSRAIAALDSVLADTSSSYRSDVVQVVREVRTALGNAPPAAIRPLAGQSQVAIAGSLVATPPAVVVTDSSGNPLAGVTVVFTRPGGAGTINDSTPVTNASGFAAVGSWRINALPGSNSLHARAPPLADTIQFLATGIGAPSVIEIVRGNNQSANKSTAVQTDPRVVVTDASGSAIRGVLVVFSVVQGGGRVADSTRTTNSSGHASGGYWLLGPNPGTNRVVARVQSDTTISVSFEATAWEPALPLSMTLRSGDSQTTSAGDYVPEPPSVRVTDAAGRVVEGVPVSFSFVLVGAGPGRIEGTVRGDTGDPLGSVHIALAGSSLASVTNAQGDFVLSGVPSGLHTIALARIGFQMMQVVDHLVVPGQTTTVDRTLSSIPGLQPIQMVQGDQNPGVTGNSTTTDSRGVARVGSWRLYTGQNRLRASSPTMADSVTFTATGM